MLRNIRYRMEAAIAWLWLKIMRAVPLDRASSIGGAIGRAIGPLTRPHRTAQRNLARAMPHLSLSEQEHILQGMWDNLGRVTAEFAHLPTKALSERVTLHGWENAVPFLENGQGVLFIAGHIGNWEMAPKTAADAGVPLTLIYRHANNPQVDAMIHKMRSPYYTGMFAKNAAGAFKLVRALKEGRSIGILIDQKMNDGIAVPFFGRDAMTSPSVAQLALTFGAPVIPARVIRTGGAHFEVMVYPPMEFVQTGNLEIDIPAAMTEVNALLESWIREYPEQWFWVHNRWPKER